MREVLGLLDNGERLAWRISRCPDDADWMFKPEKAEVDFSGERRRGEGEHRTPPPARRIDHSAQIGETIARRTQERTVAAATANGSPTVSRADRPLR